MTDYRCATCATNDPTRYVRCTLPDCPDGRDQLQRDLGRHRPLFTKSDFQKSMLTSDKLASPNPQPPVAMTSEELNKILGSVEIKSASHGPRMSVEESQRVNELFYGNKIQAGNYVARKVLDENPLVAAVVQREIERATVQNERERRFVIYGMIASLSFAIGIIIGSFA